MWERELSKGFGAVAGLGVLLLAGCSGSPKNDIDPPDLDLVSVFYPVDGLVLGFGEPGAAPEGVDHVAVQAYPTSTGACAEVEDDGSFQFSVVAIDNDVLEVTGALGTGCGVRGAPAFTRVPASPLPPVDYVCCFPTGTCQSKQNNDDGMPCPEAATGVATCEEDTHCGVLEGEYLDLEPEQIIVSSPDASGRVSIEGRVGYPGALVRVRNLGLSPLGLPSPDGRHATITDQNGNFSLTRVPASGDDELSVQVQDLNGFRSPPIGKRVPDAELVGLDIVGVYAYEDLEAYKRGPLALHIAPYGLDLKGMCPDDGQPGDWICYTGGVTHDMITGLTMTEVSSGGVLDATPTATVAGSASLQYNTGVIGDVRSAKQEIVIVLDLSESATPTGTDRQIQIEEVKRMIDQIRARDRIGAVVVEGWDVATRVNPTIGENTGMHRFEERGTLKAALDAYIRNPEEDSVSGALAGLTEAGSMLRSAGSANGKIVMLLAQAPSARFEETSTGQSQEEAYFDRRNAAFDAVVGRAELFQVRFPTHVIGLGLVNQSQDDFSFVQDVTDFSRGRYWASSKSAADIRQTLTDVQQELSGSFILLYDINTPCTGKSMSLDVQLTLELDETQRATAQWSGPVRIAGGCPEGPGGN